MLGLTIKLIGVLAFSPWKTLFAKKFTSARFFWGKKSLQIDIGNKYEGPTVDYLLITHLHYDHVQEFKTCPSGVEVLVPSGTFIEVLKSHNPNVSFRLIKSYTYLDGLTVRPFPVFHSSTTLTYGFKFTYKEKTIVWLPDYFKIPSLSHIMSKADVLFLGAGAAKKTIVHKGKWHGQASVYNTLRKIARLYNPPKKIYLMHFGAGMHPIVRKTIFLQKEFPTLNIHWTIDGKTIII